MKPKSFWNERYVLKNYVYGSDPNEFVKTALSTLNNGRVLFPLEGEGRNACYAAQKNFVVDAFDYAEQGKYKALQLFERNNVKVNYSIETADDFDYGIEKYDAIFLIFAHLPPKNRVKMHQKISKALKKGGYLFMEVFHPNQLDEKYTSGGPQTIDMLYDEALLVGDFQGLEIVKAEEKEIELNEGKYHQGKAFVTHFIAKK
ncbi:MAG: class I SAM-dependent methyltransferase [Flavobacteriaceae bacterium]|nr:class I SAM-dependent methyltransferase [Psychroflexus sp.]